MISAAQHRHQRRGPARHKHTLYPLFVTLQIHFIILANIADRMGIEAEARRIERRRLS